MIEAATEEDIPQVGKMWRAAERDLGGPNFGALRGAVANGELAVARLGDRLVGFVNFHIRRDGAATIYEILVAPAARRTGAGTKMVRYVLDRAPAGLLRLKCIRDNPANIFYKRCGFTLVGTDISSTGTTLNRWELHR